MPVIVAAMAVVVACGKDPERAKREYLASGDRYYAKAKYAEAVVEYRNAIRYDARFGDARYRLGRTYLALHDARNAYAELVRAADLLPGNVEVQLAAGRVLLLASQFDGAKQRALGVLATNAKNVDAQVLLANALAGLKDLDGAIAQTQAAIAEDPQRLVTYENLGMLQLAKGDRAAAEAAFQRAITTNPSSPMGHLGLANYYWAGGRRREAEAELQTAISLDPKSAIANRALATLYIQDHQLPLAERYLKGAADAAGDVSSKLTLADFYLTTGRGNDARTVLQPLKADATAFAPAMLRLAAIDYQSGDRAAAYKALDAIAGRDPKDVPSRLLKVRFLLQEGRLDEALKLARAANADGSDSAAGQLTLATALRAAGRADEAIDAYKKVLQTNPSMPEAQLAVAQLYMSRGDTASALQFAEQAAKADPRSAQARIALARVSIAAGRLHDADSNLESLVREQPSADAFTAQGWLAVHKRDLTKAHALYEHALSLAPDSIDALAGLVSVELSQRRRPEARTRIEASLAAAPDNVAVLTLAGRTFNALEDPARAETVYRHIVQLDPANLDAYSELARLYVASKRLPEAERDLEQFVKREPRAAGAVTMLGVVLDLQNKPDQATERYVQALAIEPRAAVAANNLAWAYARAGKNLDQALELAQTAKSQMPNRFEVDDTLGWIYYRKGLSALAISSLKQSVAGAPNNPVYMTHLGLAQAQQGNTREARQLLERALKLRSDFDGADEAQRVLRSLKG
jgi:tetratricopeptide (TPR) repeat protein